MHEVPSCVKPALHRLQLLLEPSQLRQLSSHLWGHGFLIRRGPTIPALPRALQPACLPSHSAPGSNPAHSGLASCLTSVTCVTNRTQEPLGHHPSVSASFAMRSASPPRTGLRVPSQSCPRDGTQDYYHRSTMTLGVSTLWPRATPAAFLGPVLFICIQLWLGCSAGDKQLLWRLDGSPNLQGSLLGSSGEPADANLLWATHRPCLPAASPV